MMVELEAAAVNESFCLLIDDVAGIQAILSNANRMQQIDIGRSFFKQVRFFIVANATEAQNSMRLQ